MLKSKFRSLSVLKLPAYKRFNYQPMYYDPQKEEREQRKKLAKGESINFKKNALYRDHKHPLAGSFRTYKHVHRSRVDESGQQKVRVFLLSMLMLIITLAVIGKINLYLAVPVMFILILVFIHKSKNL